MKHWLVDNPTPVDWDQPVACPVDGEIHIWNWTVDDCTGNGDRTWLDVSERDRHDRLVTIELRNRFLAAHVGLRRVLASYLACPPAVVQYQVSPTGKPHLAGDSLHFNMSHSGNHVAVAISNSGVGIDIEQVRRVTHLRSLAQKHFTVSELSTLENIGEDQIARGFFALWTRKEAVLKCLGVGLNRATSEIEIGPPVSAPIQVSIPPTWDTQAQACWLVGGRMMESLAIAVASETRIDGCNIFKVA